MEGLLNQAAAFAAVGETTETFSCLSLNDLFSEVDKTSKEDPHFNSCVAVFTQLEDDPIVRYSGYLIYRQKMGFAIGSGVVGPIVMGEQKIFSFNSSTKELNEARAIDISLEMFDNFRCAHLKLQEKKFVTYLGNQRWLPETKESINFVLFEYMVNWK